jgi:TfoX/Sxy family transcriptional regulator of competence genes
MHIDEFFLDRLRNVLRIKSILWEEKKMFGGYCFMVDDKMCFGTYQGGLMARVNPNIVPELIKRSGASQMTMGPSKRKMKGFLSIKPEGYDLDEDLEFWIDQCLAFNPLAQRSKKRQKK